MPTTYKQIWSATDGTDTTRIVFVVSDTFAELFNYDSANAVNVFRVSTVKHDRESEPGVFAVSEIALKAVEASVQTAEDQGAIDLVVGARDGLKRFCALFVDPDDADPSVTDTDIVAVIDSEIKSDVIKKSIGDYSDTWSPVYEHDIKGKSLQSDLLKDITMQEVQDEMLSDSAWLDSSLFDALQYNFTDGQYVSKLISISDFLNKLFLVVQGKIRTAIGDSNFTFNLLNSTAGYSTLPVKPRAPIASDVSFYQGYILSPSQYTRPVVFGGTDSSAENQLYFHESLFNLTEDLTDGQYNALSDANKEKYDVGKRGRSLSFMRYDSVLKLLYSLSYSLIAFMELTMPDENTINCVYKGRTDQSGQPQTIYPKDVTSAKVKRGPVGVGTVNKEFRGVAGLYADEGFDNYKSEDLNDEVYLQSTRLTKKDAEGTLLPLTLSPTLYGFVRDELVVGFQSLYYYPHNVKNHPSLRKDFVNSVHTAIYVHREDGFDPDVNLFPPCGAISFNVDGEDKFFTKMSEAVNFVNARSGKFFQTQWVIDVPFFKGFSESTTGSANNWKLAKVGNKINISGVVLDIVGITRNYDSFSVNIRAEKTEASNYTNVTGKGHSDAVLSVGSEMISDEPVYIGPKDGVKNVQLSGSVSSGDCVAIVFDSSLNKSVVKRASASVGIYGASFGVALSDGVDGESVAVLTNGIYKNSRYSFSEKQGQRLYISNAAAPDVNISADLNFLQPGGYVCQIGQVVDSDIIEVFKSTTFDGVYV